METIIESIISVIIGIVTPQVLKNLLGDPDPVESLPWLKWSVANFVGGALSGVANLIVGLWGYGVGNWAIVGVSLGIAQWYAFRGYRGYHSVNTWFVLASAIGWMLFNLGGWIVAGVAVGLMQYLSLTRYKGAGWWILGNAIAWPIAGWIATAIVVPTLGGLEFPLALVVLGGITGLLGAVLLLWPLSQLTQKQPRAGQ